MPLRAKLERCRSSVLCMNSLKIPKGVIKIRKSKKNRQHYGQMKQDKQQSTKHTHKTKDRVPRTPFVSMLNRRIMI